MRRHALVRNIPGRKRQLNSVWNVSPIGGSASSYGSASIAAKKCYFGGNGRLSHRLFSSHLSSAFVNRLELMVSRHNELLEKIEDSPEEAYLHGKELASLSHAMALHQKTRDLDIEEKSIRDLLEELESENGGDNDEMAAECLQELERIQASQKRLGNKIRIAILPKDEDDYQSDAVVEIRAGTGGDEATLFASELKQTYEKTAKSMKWECELLSESTTDLGGIKEAVLSISGRPSGGSGGHFLNDEDEEEENILANVGPYGLFKYER